MTNNNDESLSPKQPIITVCNDKNEICELKKFYSQFTPDITNNLVFDFENCKFFKVEFDNKIVGLGSVVDEDYSFSDFKRFIHVECRHKNLGQKLLDFIIQEAKNSKKLRLTGSFKKDNEKVISYFTTKGFKVTAGKEISLVTLSLK